MPNHRLFLAIKLPQELLAQLHSYQEQLNPKFFRLVEEDKLHLTLVFLGYVEEEKIKTIFDLILEITKNFQPQAIQFLDIAYGPNPKFPRLIWLEGMPNHSLEQLKKALEKEFRTKVKIDLKEENRSFLPHITLARIKTPLSNNLPLETKINTKNPSLSFGNLFSHSVRNKMNFSFSPPSLWLMESHLRREGAQYIDLEEFRFKEFKN